MPTSIRNLACLPYLFLLIPLLSFRPVAIPSLPLLTVMPAAAQEKISVFPAGFTVDWFTGKDMPCKFAAAGLSADVFSYAIRGYEYLKQHHKLAKSNIITIVDFSKPSTEERLFTVDLETGEILFKTLVAHGKNTGQQYATSFSNHESSFESSLGFYITMDTYTGSNGYSLRLKGCEKGFNDKALQRNIVVHGADYVSEEFIRKNGFLGRSHGCPALPVDQSSKIINTIRNGSCLFIYHPTKKYIKQSLFINH